MGWGKGGQWRVTGKDYKEKYNKFSEILVHYLDYGVGVYVCKDWSNCTLPMCSLLNVGYILTKMLETKQNHCPLGIWKSVIKI